MRAIRRHRKDAAQDAASRQYARQWRYHKAWAEQAVLDADLSGFALHTGAMDVLAKESPELRPT